MTKTGSRNLITDVPEIFVGNAVDKNVLTGVTVVIPTEPAVAAVDIRGGGTGTRDVAALGLDGSVERIHGLVLSGGSAFGLDAAGGVMSWLATRGKGFSIGSARVPIVPQAILFDLLNGGNKKWGSEPPYWTLGHKAADVAKLNFPLGNAGVGLGAIAGDLKGGLGSASVFVEELDMTVGALVAVNCAGNVLLTGTSAFNAWDAELNREFGGQRPKGNHNPGAVSLPQQPHPGENTTLAVVATDADLSKQQVHRLAVIAQTGMARAIRPAHTPLDGDVVFALSTGYRPINEPIRDISLLGGHAANCLARAIARGVYEAQSLGITESYRSRFQV